MPPTSFPGQTNNPWALQDPRSQPAPAQDPQGTAAAGAEMLTWTTEMLELRQMQSLGGWSCRKCRN